MSTPAARLTTATNAQGKLAEAEKLYKQSLPIRIKIYGETSTQVATLYNNLGDLYRQQVSVRVAPPRRGVVQILIVVGLPPLLPYLRTHPSFRPARQGKLDQAIPLYKDAIATWEKTGSPNLASGLNNLAMVFEAQVRTCDVAKPSRVTMAEPRSGSTPTRGCGARDSAQGSV